MLQHRPEGFELGAVVVEKPAHVARIGRRQASDLLLQPVEIGGGANGTAALEDEVVLRVETLELDMILQPFAAGFEDILQDARIKEEGRADIELIAAGRMHRAGTPAHSGFSFEHGDGHALPRQQHGGGKPSWASANNGDV